MKSVLFLIFLTPGLMWASDLPKWITDTQSFCKGQYLCAVGEGAGLMVAQASARNNLAKIFETQVSSTESYTQSSEVESDGEIPINTTVDEFSNKKIKQKSKLQIEGSYIKLKHVTAEGFYALAVLPKKEALQGLEEKMNELDQLLVSYKKSKKRSAFFLGLREFEKRKRLNQKYHILAGRFYPAPFAESKLRSLIQQKKNKGIVLYLDFSAPKEMSKMRRVLINQFLNMGYKVVSSKNKKYDYHLKAQFKREKEYLKVKGFEKYKYSLNLETKNMLGQKIGGIRIEKKELGRTKSQADKKGMVIIAKFLPEKIKELEID